MDIPELAIIILAALLMAALIAVIWLYTATKSIIKTRHIQAQAYNNKLINEIIEWAVNIAKLGSGGGLPIVISGNEKRETRLIRMNWALEYQTINARAKYIMVIAATMNHEKSLQSLLKTINNQLEEFTKRLWEFVACEENSIEEQELAEEVKNSEKELQEYAFNLIEQANAIRSVETK